MAYTESSISYFENDLAKIRAKPGMYIGSTDAEGVSNLLRECIDNALDEAKAGRNNLVRVHVAKELTVIDNGVGIPVGKHPIAKISTLTHVLTSLQSSGKMAGEAYKNAIGTHGAGLKAVNALSANLRVWTYRKDSGGWYFTQFQKGKQKVAVKKCLAPKFEGVALKSGTMIQFVPDPEIFGNAIVAMKQLLEWAKISSYLNPGVLFSIKGATLAEKTFKSVNGAQDYLLYALKKLGLESEGKLVIITTPAVDIALAFTVGQDCHMDWFTNTVKNSDGGFHADSMLKALMESLKPFGKKFTLSDLRAGLVGLFNIRMNAPTFSSQTKDKLVDLRAKEPCYNECLALFNAWWLKNKAQARALAQRAAEYNKAVIDFRQNTKAMRKLHVSKRIKVLLPGKLTQAVGFKPQEKELYLVEGESAGGTAKIARMPNQEIFALRGKILNAARNTPAKVLASDEIIGILQAIGFDPSLKEPMCNLRVGRVILLPDSDIDGKHIAALLLTLLWKYIPHLIHNGMVYTVAAKEFTVMYKGKRLFADSLEGIQQQTGGILPKDVSHLKGWGEASAIALSEMAFNPTMRRLFRILPPKDRQSANTFDLIMNNDVSYRKKLLGV